MYLIVGPAGARSGFFSFFLAVPSAHFVHYELKGGPLLQAMQNYFAAKWERWSSRRAMLGADQVPPQQLDQGSHEGTAQLGNKG